MDDSDFFIYITKIIDLNSLKDMFTSVCVICNYCLHLSILNISWILKKSI